MAHGDSQFRQPIPNNNYAEPPSRSSPFTNPLKSAVGGEIVHVPNASASPVNSAAAGATAIGATAAAAESSSAAAALGAFFTVAGSAAALSILGLLFPPATGDPEYKNPQSRPVPRNIPITDGNPPFKGGQSPVYYVVTIHTTIYSKPPTGGEYTVFNDTTNTFTLIGPISFVKTREQSDTSSAIGLYAPYTIEGGGRRNITGAGTYGNLDFKLDYEVLSMTRQDGQPDIGGNPPSEIRNGGQQGNNLSSPSPIFNPDNQIGNPKFNPNGIGASQSNSPIASNKSGTDQGNRLGSPIGGSAGSGSAGSESALPTKSANPNTAPAPANIGSFPSSTSTFSPGVTTNNSSVAPATNNKLVGLPIVLSNPQTVTAPRTAPAPITPYIPSNLTNIPSPVNPILEPIYLQNQEAINQIKGLNTTLPKAIAASPEVNNKQIQNTRDAICVESQPEGCIGKSISNNNVLLADTCLQEYEVANCKIFDKCDLDSKPTFTMKAITVQLGDKIVTENFFEKIYNIESKQCDIKEEFYAIPISTYHQNVVFQPQISLLFKETLANAKSLNRERIKMYCNIRILNKTVENISNADITNFTNKINSVFPVDYIFNKGKLHYVYFDYDKGYRIKLFCLSLEVAKTFITKVFSIQDDIPDFNKLLVSGFTDKDLSLSESKVILGKTITMPERRQLANVLLVRSELKLHGNIPDLILVDRSKST
jgi:hypothetical protein